MASRAVLSRAGTLSCLSRRVPALSSRSVGVSRTSQRFASSQSFNETWNQQAKVYSDAKKSEVLSGRPNASVYESSVYNTTLEHAREHVEGGVQPTWKDFPRRHIGPRDEEIPEMLKALGPGAETMEAFINQVIPKDVQLPPKHKVAQEPFDESTFADMFGELAKSNKPAKYLNGGGYYPVETPPVIRRNILESPAWYTQYTPYQAEISQGRLESLLNFQTMVSDLTGLPIANASLLDEGTAAAEAMTLSLNTLPASRAKRAGKTYLVSDRTHERTIEVLRGRAEGFGIEIKVVSLEGDEAAKLIDELGDDLVGALVQYPDTVGNVHNYRDLAQKIHAKGALVSAATDLSALTLLTPPGEWGADIAFGNSQRFGIPLGYGGPHAAFMAVKESSKRRLPGRLVGVSKDRLGRPAMRLALQTREQHIRREKATSNVCTAQALLANMAAMYAVWHGPAALKDMAIRNVLYARVVAQLAQSYGHEIVTSSQLSDTVTIKHKSREAAEKFRDVLATANEGRVDVGTNFGTLETTLACTAELGFSTVAHLANGFAELQAFNGSQSPANASEILNKATEVWNEVFSTSREAFLSGIPEEFRRTSEYLTHPVFNSYHSETEMLRYIHHLQGKDLSLTHAMIPLGSCTMKLNASSQMELISMTGHGNVHPLSQLSGQGHQLGADLLRRQIEGLTGMDASTIQPNSGAQGEFAGLRAIRKYHLTQNGGKRDVCLIPSSAHGTNPASAAMAGMRVVMVKCEVETGNLDMADLEAKCKKHADELGAIMITYPSTFGVFEPDIVKICKTVHDHGGQVYMDGANMNAQIGLTSPGTLGADVCHLNLHKTFCIPHGGGGPGVGPICVKSHLAPYLPEGEGQVPISSAPLGSASILPISWAYISTMGDEGLRKATTMALLNANYILARLKPHYPIVYLNDNGRCAHEFILDTRKFKETCGVEAADISKRLQDYGFHPPTLSFPIPNTLMIEPTESESKQELDRLADALISIRQEMREIEEGKQPREGNVLKMAPHSQIDIVQGDGAGAWDRPYSREKAVYPVAGLKERKFWPSVSRVDDTFGDMNLYCTCPPIEDYLEEGN